MIVFIICSTKSTGNQCVNVMTRLGANEVGRLILGLNGIPRTGYSARAGELVFFFFIYPCHDTRGHIFSRQMF